ncbi:hypothetical protein CCMA1212_001995 [Trichoderma ghanense]|uniref:Uncharacterized protein n=1 Tax=Trichoderma ghanense TaxID=65468 RepID=A0ABY2HEB1_9HYPO
MPRQMLIFPMGIICNATSGPRLQGHQSFSSSKKQQLPANRRASLAEPSIAMASRRPELLHERLFKMKRAWSDALVETRHC